MPDVAAFDFDGTLTRGGSVFGYLTALRGKSAVLEAIVALGPRLARAAITGGSAADRTKEDVFIRVLSGTRADDAARVATRFGREHLRGHLRPEVSRRLDWHLGRGDRVVIVSASPELYVAVAGTQLGVHEVIATRLEVDGTGRLTGRYDGANCRGEEKLRRLHRSIGQLGSPPDRLWAYGNSRGDLEMLEAADIGIDVGMLGRLGRLRTFPRLEETGPGAGDEATIG